MNIYPVIQLIFKGVKEVNDVNDFLNIDKATKDSWKNQKMPDNKVSFKIDKEYTKKEMKKIKLGFVPGKMEDKWFIYFEDNTSYCHRSWTGYCVYEVKFAEKNDKYYIDKAFYNPEIAEKKETFVLKDEIKTVLFLIDRILLDKNVSFPIPTSKKKNKTIYT